MGKGGWLEIPGYRSRLSGMWAREAMDAPRPQRRTLALWFLHNLQCVLSETGDVLAEKVEVRASHTECVLCDFLLYTFKNYL